MNKFDPKKLKDLKSNIDNYLLKNDPAYRIDREKRSKESKLQEDLITNLLTKNQEFMKKISENIGGVGTQITETLLKKVIFEYIAKQMDLSFLDLKKSVDSIQIPKVSGKDLGIDKVISQLETVDKSIVDLGKNDIGMVEVVQELKNLQNGINNLLKKDIKIPDFPTFISVDGITNLGKKLDDVIITLKGLPKNIPKSASFDSSDIVSSINELKTYLDKLKPASIDFPESFSVNNFPVQKYPQPVTNININPLRGLVHTSTTTVTTTLKTLPEYGVLENRRSIIFYNNGSNTVYIGGSDVTPSNGLPILPSTFSPAVDSGPTQVWYAVTSSGSSDVRCVEVQNNSGA